MKFRTIWMSASLALVLCVSAIEANVFQDPNIKTIPLRFKPGTFSTTVAGTVKGYVVNDYKFKAEGGQMLKVKLTSRSPSVTFNILPAENQSSGEALNADPQPIQQTEWQGVLQKAGEYIVRVGMNRNEARRGRAFSYSLVVDIR